VRGREKALESLRHMYERNSKDLNVGIRYYFCKGCLEIPGDLLRHF